MHITKSSILPFFPQLELFLFIVSFHNCSATDVYRNNHTKQGMKTGRVIPSKTSNISKIITSIDYKHIYRLSSDGQ